MTVGASAMYKGTHAHTSNQQRSQGGFMKISNSKSFGGGGGGGLVVKN